MPTYEYYCEKCGITFEYFQSMKDEPLKTCIHPEGCQHQKSKAKVKRLLGTGAGLLFKGDGFYITDYRSSSYKEGAKKEKTYSDTGKTDSSPKKEESKSSIAAPTATK